MVSKHHFVVFVLVLVFFSYSKGYVVVPAPGTTCHCVSVDVPPGRTCYNLPAGVSWGPCIEEESCPQVYECSPVHTELECKFIEIPTRVIKIGNGCDRIDKPYTKLVLDI